MQGIFRGSESPGLMGVWTCSVGRRELTQPPPAPSNWSESVFMEGRTRRGSPAPGQHFSHGNGASGTGRLRMGLKAKTSAKTGHISKREPWAPVSVPATLWPHRHLLWLGYNSDLALFLFWPRQFGIPRTRTSKPKHHMSSFGRWSIDLTQSFQRKPN